MIRLHACWLDRECRYYGSPPRTYLHLFPLPEGRGYKFSVWVSPPHRDPTAFMPAGAVRRWRWGELGYYRRR